MDVDKDQKVADEKHLFEDIQIFKSHGHEKGEDLDHNNVDKCNARIVQVCNVFLRGIVGDEDIDGDQCWDDWLLHQGSADHSAALVGDVPFIQVPLHPSVLINLSAIFIFRSPVRSPRDQ